MVMYTQWTEVCSPQSNAYYTDDYTLIESQHTNLNTDTFFIFFTEYKRKNI